MSASSRSVADGCAAIDAFSATFAATAGRHAPGPAAWLQAVRRDAFARFAGRGIPTTRDEAWRVTSLAALASIAWGPASGEPVVSAEAYAALGLPEAKGARLVFADGRLVPALSRAGELSSACGNEGPGLTVLPLAQASASHRELLEPALGLCAADEHPFRALSEASWTDGAFIHVAKGKAPALAVHVVSLSTGVEQDVAFHPRVVLLLEEGANLSVVEIHASLGAGRAFSNAVTDAVLAPSARLSHVRVEHEDQGVTHLGSVRARLARNAVFESVAATLGGTLARVEVDVLLGGEGAECDLSGVYAGGGSRHLDHQTNVDHALPHGTSRQLEVGILSGRAMGVFNGRVLVREDAQKTDARQSNRNLLLSREALVDTKPQLEIHADDVKCAHGATIGRLAEDALFYLRSRGLAESEARQLLTQAFAVEAVAGVRDVPVGDWLRGLLATAVTAAEGERP